MSIQPFICLGAETINDPALNGVSLLAELLWRKIYQGCDSHCRFSDDIEVIRGALLAKRPSIRTEQVAHALDELKRASLIHSRSTGAKSWIEIADPYRHRSKSYRDPRFGFMPEPEREQKELPLGPVALSPPPARVRIEREEEKEPKRVLARSGEDSLLEQIREIVDEKEMEQNGGMWRTRIRHCAKAVRYAIEDWKLRTPASPPIKNSRAAWLTDRYARALVEISSNAISQSRQSHGVK